jgi:hypothetical protein
MQLDEPVRVHWQRRVLIHRSGSAMSGTALFVARAAAGGATIANLPEHSAIDAAVNGAGETAEQAILGAAATMATGVCAPAAAPLADIVSGRELHRVAARFVAAGESQDKLGNFEIQMLMSEYNEAEQLASNVQKKQDDTDKDLIHKIG